MTDHPITPPPELVGQWRAAASNVPASLSTDPGGRRDYIDYIATQAARWGADQELEACCQWQDVFNYQNASNLLRAARRPKPPSLKEQALAVLDDAYGRLDAAVDDVYGWLDAAHENILRRALEQLDD